MPADRELVMRLQMALRARGFELGNTGPARDGVDGDPGDRTILAALTLAESRTGVETPETEPGLTDPAAFYAHLRKSGLFGSGLSLPQVEGINYKLAAMAAARWPLSWAAAGLATSYHETGKRMQPVREGFASSTAEAISILDRAWAKGQLRWVKAPYWRDGWFGRGDAQVTHEENYRKVGDAIGVDLVSDPDLMLRPDISAKALIVGMERGIYTGKSLPGVLGRNNGRRSRNDYEDTRPIINGTDKADMIAGYCLVFEAALVAGGWKA